MARTITSPGVQVIETDLSVHPDITAGTSVLVPGFAAQGPTSEPLLITSVSELEAIYGVPQTAAEKYFHYSAKEVLNSPARLTTLRLPYGEGAGTDFTDQYSALLFPISLSANNVTLSAATLSAFQIGRPTHVNLTQAQYDDLVKGNTEWNTITQTSTTGSLSVGSSETYLSAGVIVINDLQTTINNYGEGYYVGLADNSNVYGDSVNFDAVTTVFTLSGSSVLAQLNSSVLEFALSATQAESAYLDSVSEQLEKIGGFIDFETDSYRDFLNIGVYRLRRSNVDDSTLAISYLEAYSGSLNSTRVVASPQGGTVNAFLEEKVNTSSPTIKVLVNPKISRDFAWSTNNTTTPNGVVRVASGAKHVFPVGVYTATAADATNKIIGNVPTKLEKALRTVEVVENTTIDVVVDAGLTTVYAHTEGVGLSAFDDTVFVPVDTNTKGDWASVATTLTNFAENTRRDCVAVLDPLRSIFVSGRDTKVLDVSTNTFAQHVYSPLKDLVNSARTNYAALYGNWIKTFDSFTGRRMWVPFSGYAAAVMSRSDQTSYPWSAPAGLNRGTFNALDIAFNPNQKQRDRLYEISVNPVVFFSGDGYTVFGQKTLETRPSAFDRINVRRLFLYLERATQRTLKYFVFEPNTEFTRTRLRNAITPLFELAKNTEGIYDYRIICDERNNLPETIDRNEIVVDVYIQPVRTGEYILLNFIATRTGQDAFTELI